MQLDIIWNIPKFNQSILLIVLTVLDHLCKLIRFFLIFQRLSSRQLGTWSRIPYTDTKLEWNRDGGHINKTLRFCRVCIDVVFILSSLMSTCELDRFVIQSTYIKVVKSCSAPFVDRRVLGYLVLRKEPSSYATHDRQTWTNVFKSSIPFSAIVCHSLPSRQPSSTLLTKERSLILASHLPDFSRQHL